MCFSKTPLVRRVYETSFDQNGIPSGLLNDQNILRHVTWPGTKHTQEIGLLLAAGQYSWLTP